MRCIRPAVASAVQEGSEGEGGGESEEGARGEGDRERGTRGEKVERRERDRSIHARHAVANLNQSEARVIAIFSADFCLTRCVYVSVCDLFSRRDVRFNSIKKTLIIPQRAIW